jgi:membrane protein
VPRYRTDWRAAAAGAVLAALLILVARPVFLTYVWQFASYNLIYGSLAIVIILIIWAWIVAGITIFGGEVVSHIQTIMLEREPAEDAERRRKWWSPPHREAGDEAPHQELQGRQAHNQRSLRKRAQAALEGHD